VVVGPRANAELEQPAVELERLVDIADLQHGVVDPDDPTRARSIAERVVPAGVRDKRT
jgi:hypothetical protein